MTRATHDLTDFHHGTRTAATVALAATIDTALVSGMTLEAAIRIVHERLLMLEDGVVTKVSSFKADAVKV
jgi:hypothetical protein